MSILFLGSSIIRKWNTETAFHNSINLGISGITSSQLTKVYSHIFDTSHSSTICDIVLYCGSNDFNDGNATFGSTVANIIEFIFYLHSHFPKTSIYYIGIIKSPDRTPATIKMIDVCNREMKKWIKTVDYVQYITTTTIVSSHNHFRKDGRHLTKAGYTVLERLVYSKLLQP